MLHLLLVHEDCKDFLLVIDLLIFKLNIVELADLFHHQVVCPLGCGFLHLVNIESHHYDQKLQKTLHFNQYMDLIGLESYPPIGELLLSFNLILYCFDINPTQLLKTHLIPNCVQ